VPLSFKAKPRMSIAYTGVLPPGLMELSAAASSLVGSPVSDESSLEIEVRPSEDSGRQPREARGTLPTSTNLEVPGEGRAAESRVKKGGEDDVTECEITDLDIDLKSTSV